MRAFLAVLTDPEVLMDAAAVVAMIPLPESGPAAAGLRLLASVFRAHKSAAEIDAITAKYSAEASQIVDGW